MINKIYKIIITALRKVRILCGKFLWGMGRRYKGKGRGKGTRGLMFECLNVRMLECMNV